MLKIETQIEINASAKEVWDCLLDFERYPEWNPLIRFIVGEAKIGTKLHVRITPPGLVDSKYILDILAVVPQKEFRWLGHFILPGLMDGSHAFIIEPLSVNTTRLIQNENFNGFLVPVMSQFLKRNMRQGFEQVNLALKKRVEALQ